MNCKQNLGNSFQLISRKCLFCANDTTEETPLIIKTEPGLDPIKINLNPDVVIKNELKSIFIVQKLLDITREKLQKYLKQNDGKSSPSSWFSICIFCREIVEKCYSVYWEILRLENEFKEMKNTLKWSIFQSLDQEDGGYGRKLIDPNCIFSDIRNSVGIDTTNNEHQDVKNSINEPFPIPKQQKKRKTQGTSVTKRHSSYKKKMKAYEAISGGNGMAVGYSVSVKDEVGSDMKLFPNDIFLESDSNQDNDYLSNLIQFPITDGVDEKYDDSNWRSPATGKVEEDELKTQARKKQRRSKKTNAQESPGPSKSLESKIKKEKKQARQKLKCSECMAQYYDESKLDEHFKLMHEAGLGKKCEECGVFVNKDRMYDHVRMHRRPKGNYKPKIDPERPKFLELDRTFKGIPWYCDHCEGICLGPSRLVNHMELLHPGISRVVCETCSESFPSTQMVKLHCQIKHPEGMTEPLLDDQPYPEPKPCEHCTISFESKWKMDLHLAKDHPKIYNKCPECNYIGPSYTDLYFHKKMVHEKNNPRKFSCELCSKIFNLKYSLDKHRRAEHFEELGLEPFKCEYKDCGIVVGDKKTLEKHIKSVHENTKKFVCSYCGKSFGYECSLEQHLLLHTAPKEKQYKQGPFTCRYCDYAVNLRPTLYYHMKKVHSDKYEYRCEKCNKGYDFLRTLHLHQKSCYSDGPDKTLRTDVNDPPKSKVTPSTSIKTLNIIVKVKDEDSESDP